MTVTFPRWTGVPVTAALFLFGCAAPDASDAEPDTEGTAFLAQRGPDGLDDPRATYAVLAAAGQAVSVTLLDSAGTPGLTIPVALPRATGLTVHPDGFFILKADRRLYSVATDGRVDEFNDTRFPWLYGATAAPDGTVSVAAESEVVELNAGGEIVNRVPTGGTYCWMDTTVHADSDGSESTVVDLWGSTLASVTEDRELDVIAHLPFDSVDITTRDADGRHWFARTDDGNVYAWDESDGPRWIADVSVSGLEGVRSLMPRADGSMLAIAQTVSGVSAVRIDIDGNTTTAWTRSGVLWLDVAEVL